jgi:hypothetical protein
MKTITLEVPDVLAEKIERMSPTERTAIFDTITKFVINRRSMEEIMDDISDQAERNGLTEEVLDKILKEIKDEKRP